MIKDNAKLKVKTEKKPDELVVFISGDIDEDSVFEDIHRELPPKVTIDLTHMKYINSCGLRNWVNWMRKLQKDTLVVFRNCTKSVVDQMNILEGFGPVGAVVESFFVPYYCESCETEDNFLAKRGIDYMEHTSDKPEMNKIPFSRPCPKCGTLMEMDIMPKKYFKFFLKKIA